MEIRRFGVGHRRSEGPAGTHGVEGQAIHADEHGVIAELAFRPKASIVPHSNPNLTYFLVLEGGGFVQVGDERRRVAAGEAVVWPPDVVHGAWTDETPMRALVVEFPIGEVTTQERAEGAEADETDAVAGTVVQLNPEAAPDRASPEKEPW